MALQSLRKSESILKAACMLSIIAWGMNFATIMFKTKNLWFLPMANTNYGVAYTHKKRK